jgi:hypothetical protein
MTGHPPFSLAHTIPQYPLLRERNNRPHYPLLAVQPGCCTWPFGDPRNPDFRFCGRPKVDRRVPYCAEHQALSRIPAESMTETEPFLRSSAHVRI